MTRSLAIALLCAACTATAPARTGLDVEAPRSVAEAVGAAELALAPIAMACDPRDQHAQTTWCRAYQGRELEEVFTRPEWGAPATVGIALHERGHALDLAKGLPIRGAEAEQSADAWAGCGLYLLGLPAGPYLSVVQHLDVADYPERARAVEDGARACADQEIP